MENAETYPLVTVVIPTYNRAALLPQAIRSVLEQTYSNLELIIADDGSTDETSSIVLEFRDPRVRYLQLPHSGHPGRTRNAGAQMGSGQWLAFLDSDDLWLPGKLQLQLEKLEETGGKWCYTNYELMDEAGNTVPPRSGKYQPISGMITEQVLTNTAAVFIGTLLIEKNLFDSTGGFNEEERLAFRGDYELALRISLQAEALALPDITARVREHPGRSTKQLADSHKRTAMAYQVFMEKDPPLHLKKIAERRRAELLSAAREANSRDTGFRNFIKNVFSILGSSEKRKFFGLVILDVFIALLDLAFLALLIFVVGFYTGTITTDRLPVWAMEFINGHPLFLIGSFLILFGIKNLLGFLVFKMQFGYVYQVASRLSEQNLRNYLDGSYIDFVNIDSSIQIRRISQQTIEFSHHVLRGIQQIITSSILVLMTITAIIIFNPLLFGLLFAMMVPAILLIAYITRKKLVHIRTAARTHREKSIQYLNEAIDGFVESNIYQKKEFFVGRYRRFQEKFNEGLAQQQVIQNLPARMMEVFAVLGLFLLILINTYFIKSGSVLLLIGAFIAAAYKIIPGIVRILNSLQQVRIFSYTVGELKKEKPANKTHMISMDDLGSVSFQNVSYSYDRNPVINNLSFHIEKGMFMGISAPSGKGKTTLLNLLLGFLEPRSGKILFNAKAVTKEERKSFWSQIAYSRQQPFVIHDSIQHNISLSEEPDMEKLWTAIKETGLFEFVSSAEKGLDTIITEAGKNISGGQRQRLMIARALYRDADLLILDEPFNELDELSVINLLHHLQTLSEKGKMVILVTHDKRSLAFCNQIMRLDEN